MQKSLVLTLGLVLGSCQGSGSDSVTPAVTVESPTALTGFLNPTESAAIQRVMSKEKAVPVFREVEGRLELLSDCYYPGDLEFESRTVQVKTNHELNEADFVLSALSIVELSGGGQTEYSVSEGVIGLWKSKIESPSLDDLANRCPEATHVASAIFVGALEAQQQSSTGGSEKLGRGPFGGGAGQQRGEASVVSVGDISKCTAENMAKIENGQAMGCDAPTRVEVMRIDRNYYYDFDTSVVTGTRTGDPTILSADLQRLEEELKVALNEQARPFGIKVVSDARKKGVHCDTEVESTYNRYSITCKREDGTLVAQNNGEREAIRAGIPAVAQSLIPNDNPNAKRSEPTARRSRVGRLIVLVDISSSMVVNDPGTFVFSHVRESHRHKIVNALLDGLLANNISPSVGLVVFAGNGCTQSVSVNGSDLWPLDIASKSQALEWLSGELEVSPCIDGTDIASALLEARTILQKHPRSEHGHDAVILLTDGDHRAIGSSRVPKDEALALDGAGVSLHVYRIQLNDLDSLRYTLENPRKRAPILARWAKFSGQTIEDWKEEITETSSENDKGTKLLANLAGTKLGTLFMTTDDNTDPLLVVHTEFLPKLGALAVAEAQTCSQATDLVSRDGSKFWQMHCDTYVPLGRDLIVKVEISTCMERVLSALIQGDGVVVEMRPARRDGSTVTFEPSKLATAAPSNRVEIGQAKLIIKSEFRPEGPSCQ